MSETKNVPNSLVNGKVDKIYPVKVLQNVSLPDAKKLANAEKSHDVDKFETSRHIRMLTE